MLEVYVFWLRQSCIPNVWTFVWDSSKSSLNATKHGVTFDQAMTVFSDPLAYHSDGSVKKESRMFVLGRDRAGAILYVVHAVREDDQVRIISARRAEPREVKNYEEPG